MSALMGLFDGIRASLDQGFNTQEAVMTIVIAAVLADGDIADEEVSRVRSMCSLSPLFASNTGNEDMTVINYALRKNKQLGSDACAAAGRELSIELREMAFAFACDMVMADSMVDIKEEIFLDTLADQLEISKPIARSIVDVTLIRNRK